MIYIQAKISSHPIENWMTCSVVCLSIQSLGNTVQEWGYKRMGDFFPSYHMVTFQNFYFNNTRSGGRMKQIILTYVQSDLEK